MSESLCKKTMIDFITREYVAIPHCSYQTALSHICKDLSLEYVLPPEGKLIPIHTMEGHLFLYDMQRECLLLKNRKKR